MFSFEFDGYAIDLLFASARSDHRSARIGKTESYCASDAGGATDNDRYFALQIDGGRFHRFVDCAAN
jgi:hypothetical protein